MKASVVICTYNRSELLSDALRSLESQDFPLGQYEIIVVDNNSTDDTRDVVDRMLASSPVVIKYVLEIRQGLSHARNAGIQAASGEIIAFTDDDAEADKSWLGELVSVFSSPDVAASGGPIRPIWPAKKPDWLTEALQGALTISEFTEVADTGEFKYPNYPWGVNMAFRKDIFKSVGMFHTNLGRIAGCLLSNEELGICRKIEETNQRILFAPGAIVYHKIPAERLKKIWFYHRYYWQGRSDALMMLDDGADAYGRLRKYAAELLWRESTPNGNELETKCLNRMVKGYFFQILETLGTGHGNDNFRKLRVLETYCGGMQKMAVQQAMSAESALTDMRNYIDKKHEDLKRLLAISNEKDNLLLQFKSRVSKLVNFGDSPNIHELIRRLDDKDKELEQLSTLLVQKEADIGQLSASVQEKEYLLKDFEDRLKLYVAAENSDDITGSDNYLQGYGSKLQQLFSVFMKQRNDHLKMTSATLSQLETAKSSEISYLRTYLDKMQIELNRERKSLDVIINSWSWRITAPLRALHKALKNR